MNRKDKAATPSLLPPPVTFLLGIAIITASWSLIGQEKSGKVEALAQAADLGKSLGEEYAASGAYPTDLSDMARNKKISLKNPHYSYFSRFMHYERIDDRRAFLVFILQPHAHRAIIDIFSDESQSKYISDQLPQLARKDPVQKIRQDFEQAFTDRLVLIASVAREGIDTGAYQEWKEMEADG